MPRSPSLPVNMQIVSLSSLKALSGLQVRGLPIAEGARWRSSEIAFSCIRYAHERPHTHAVDTGFEVEGPFQEWTPPFSSSIVAGIVFTCESDVDSQKIVSIFPVAHSAVVPASGRLVPCSSQCATVIVFEPRRQEQGRQLRSVSSWSMVLIVFTQEHGNCVASGIPDRCG